MVPGFLNDRLSLEQLTKPDSPGVKPAGWWLVMAVDLVLKPRPAGTGPAGSGFQIYCVITHRRIKLAMSSLCRYQWVYLGGLRAFALRTLHLKLESV
jgi:hypothetical protein